MMLLRFALAFLFSISASQAWPQVRVAPEGVPAPASPEAPAVPPALSALPAAAPAVSGLPLPSLPGLPSLAPLSPAPSAPSLTLAAPSLDRTAAVRAESSAWGGLRALERGRKPSASKPKSAESDRQEAGRRFDQTRTSPAEVNVPSAGPSLLPAAPGRRASLPIRTFKLANGLTVVVQTDKSSPMVAVSLAYRVGSQDERPGREGFAHLFEHLMFQGTRNIKPEDWDGMIESRGGMQNADTWKSMTKYYTLVPRTALSLVLWSEADRMRSLNVDERAVALEQQVVIEEKKKSYLNEPYNLAMDEVMSKAAFHKWENVHTVIGSERDLLDAKIDDVRSFYKTYYAPNNAVLALSGNVTLAEAKRLAGKYFASIPASQLPPVRDLTEPPLAKDVRVTSPDPLAKVPRLFAAWHVPPRNSRDFWALSLFARMLQGEDENPLYQALVKGSEAAVSAQAHFLWSMAPFNLRGPDLVGMDVLLKLEADAEGVLAEIDKLLARFADFGPTAEELARARAQAEFDWHNGQQFLLERAQTLSSYAALIGPPKNMRQELRTLLSITGEDVRGAVKRWLLSRGKAVVHVVPSEPGAPAPDLPAPPVPERAPRAPGEAPPGPDAARPAAPPSLRTFSLSNGLKVLAVRDGRFPIVEARLVIPAGRSTEAPGREGVSKAAAELLLKGTLKQDAATLASAFSLLGWSVRAAAGSENTYVAAAGLSRNAVSFFRQLGAVLSGAAYPFKEVELWKDNMIEELEVLNSDPGHLADERTDRELFAGHPYAKGVPTREEVEAIAPDQLVEFRRERLGPGRATLVLIGDLDPDELGPMLEDALGGWKGGASASGLPALPDSGGSRWVIVDRPSSPQANIVLAQSTTLTPKDTDFLAFSVMNHLLGGSSNARLFKNLRGEHGYTYGSYSRIAALGRGSRWEATAETRNEVVLPAIQEMMKEIRRMRDEPVPAETLESAKRYLAGVFQMRLSAMDKTADYFQQLAVQGRDPKDVLDNYLRRLQALTPEDIQRAARTYLDPDKVVGVIVGDRSVLEPVLGPAAPQAPKPAGAGGS